MSMIFKSQKTIWSWSWNKRISYPNYFLFYLILKVLVLKGEYSW